jgi:putative transcriptional regulator
MKLNAPRLTLINTRKSLGMTQEDLASKVRISRAYLANIEGGKYTPSLEVAKKISHILNRSIDELFL